MSVPSLVAFDLDDTLWSPEMWLCSGTPFTKVPSTGEVCCRDGEKMRLLGDPAAILELLATDPRFASTKVVYVSRTIYPECATPLLSLMDVSETRTMEDICEAEWNQIFPGNKQKHFRNLSKQSNIPLSEMLFFDNQMDNIESVGPLGVACVFTPEGMTMAHFEGGLEEFASKSGRGD